MNYLKSIFLTVLVGLSLTLPNLAAAQVPAVATPPKIDTLKKENFNYFINGQTTIASFLHSILCYIAEVSPLNSCLAYESDQSVKVGEAPRAVAVVTDQPISGGALGYTGNLMASLYDSPPTSTAYYVANLGDNLGIGITAAHAQVGGAGNSILTPVFNLWTVSRNLAYLIAILVFMVIGLMIMMRHRINPQTVVTAQQAIPGLIIGMVLITFSYFFASLIVDLAFLGTQLVGRIFILAGSNVFEQPNGPHIIDLINSASIADLFSTAAFQPGALGTSSAVQSAAGGIGGQVTTILGGAGSIITAVIGAIIGNLLTHGIIGTAVGAGAGYFYGQDISQRVIPLLVQVILVIALFFQMIRLFFSIVMAYIEILVFTILGPFLILFGSIPGRSGAIGYWWRTILANVLVFPAVFAAFLLAGAVLGASQVVGSVKLPLFGNSDVDFIRAILAFGILLGTHSIPKAIKDAIGVKPAAALAEAAQASVQQATGVARTTATNIPRAVRVAMGR